jgi:hypothetical protein
VEAAVIAEVRGWEMAINAINDATQVLSDNGMTVFETPVQLTKDFAVIGATMLEEWKVSAGADPAAIIDAMK